MKLKINPGKNRLSTVPGIFGKKNTAKPPQASAAQHYSSLLQRTAASRQSLTHGDIMQLQKTFGNRAVVQMLEQTRTKRPTENRAGKDAGDYQAAQMAGKGKRQQKLRRQQLYFWTQRLQDQRGIAIAEHELNRILNLGMSYPDMDSLAGIAGVTTGAQIVQLANRQRPVQQIVALANANPAEDIVQIAPLLELVGGENPIPHITGLINGVNGKNGDAGMLANLLANFQNDPLPLMDFIEVINNVNHLQPLLDAVANRRLLYRLLDAEPNGNAVLTCIPLIDNVAFLPDLLAAVGNTALLQTLLVRLGNGQELLDLVNTVDDAGTLDQLLQLVPNAGTLQAILNISNRGELIISLVQEVNAKNGNAAMLPALLTAEGGDPLPLLDFLQVITDANHLAGLFVLIPNRRDLYRLLETVPNGQHLTDLYNHVGANGTAEEIIELVQTVQRHNGGTAITDIDLMVQAAPAAGNLCVHLTTLVDHVQNHDTVAQTTALITRARLHDNGATILQIDTLVQAAPAAANLSTDLTTLTNRVGANGTVTQTTDLITRARHYDNGATTLQVDALVHAAPAAANLCVHLRDLVNHVAANGTIPQTTDLIAAVRNHHNAATTLNVDQLVQDATAVANICVDLTNLINEIQNNGNIAQIRQLLQRSVTTLGAGNTNQLIPLIHRNAAQNTPVHVRAFLIALNPNNLARYQQIQPKIPRFLGNAAPGHADYNVTMHGYPFRSNRWDHFYERHTYECYDFAQTDNGQGIWPVGTNTRDQLRAVFPGITAMDVATLRGAGDTSVDVANHRVGVSNSGFWITQFFPLAGAYDDFYRRAEMDAIEDLR